MCYDVKVLRGAPAHTAGVHGAQWGKLPYMNREQIADYSRSYLLNERSAAMFLFYEPTTDNIGEGKM